MEIYQNLGKWFDLEKRDLPWRSSSDPYRIWLSEIILHQTRVAQGTAYYHRFLEKFPDVFSLAEANTDDVLKIWQGLGYYSRARNLHETARIIAFERNGRFPDNYSDLLKLKGIGEYTAAAISSIAFAEPKAAVDGNVKRVISRLFSVSEEINSPKGKKIIDALATEILDHENPGRHNQAVMELGASVCLPKKPLCISCPLNSVCMALQENRVSELPLKYNKTIVKDRFFNYLLIKHGTLIKLQQRTGGEIWEGLYEFPLIETPGLTAPEDYPGLIALFLKSDPGNFNIIRVSEPVYHKLSHRNIISCFLHLSVPVYSDFTRLPGKQIEISEFHEFPVPKLIERYISSAGF